MKCPECNHEDVMMIVDVIVMAPSSYHGNLDKKSFRKKEVSLLGVNWGKMSLICQACGWKALERLEEMT